jgi:hypothetical protein
MEWDSTSVDKHITLKSLRFYDIGRHVEENRRAETTKELRNTTIKFCGLHFSPNKIRATSWRNITWAGNGRNEKYVQNFSPNA